MDPVCNRVPTLYLMMMAFNTTPEQCHDVGGGWHNVCNTCLPCLHHGWGEKRGKHLLHIGFSIVNNGVKVWGRGVKHISETIHCERSWDTWPGHWSTMLRKYLTPTTIRNIRLIRRSRLMEQLPATFIRIESSAACVPMFGWICQHNYHNKLVLQINILFHPAWL